MKALLSLIANFLSRRGLVYGFILFTCVFSLAMAFTAEGFFGLEPCRLCVTQRYPFAIGAVLSLIGLIIVKRGRRAHAGLFGLLSLNFLTNSGIAFYHTGVERHWWPSDELCKLPPMSEGTSFLENIMSAPMGRCDEIPWADPLLGLSMANYNVLLCLGLSVLCASGAAMAFGCEEETKTDEQTGS
ncbi:MAG: disulfide bond formation protein B [Alphaproteobacteria bacterium]|nr:disulfide bond formation protein B [Alphaproteobacteria bacterium]MCB9974029.1 disulfide bond formation protein B [Rhodospirillales bacterium]